MNDKYEEAAREIVDGEGTCENENEECARIMAILRETFPMQGAVPVDNGIWDDAPSNMESREYATLAWVEYRNFDGTTDRSRSYHRPFHNFKPLPAQPKDGTR